MSTQTPESIIPDGDDERAGKDYQQARDRETHEVRTGVEGESDDTSLPDNYVAADGAEDEGDDAPYGDVRAKRQAQSGKGRTQTQQQ